MKDYKLFYNPGDTSLTLTDYQLKQTTLSFNYDASDSIFVLQYFNNGKESKLLGKAIDWRKLPALKSGFHWTIDAN